MWNYNLTIPWINITQLLCECSIDQSIYDWVVKRDHYVPTWKIIILPRIHNIIFVLMNHNLCNNRHTITIIKPLNKTITQLLASESSSVKTNNAVRELNAKAQRRQRTCPGRYPSKHLFLFTVYVRGACAWAHWVTKNKWSA